jgi:hypothetical protein
MLSVMLLKAAQASVALTMRAASANRAAIAPDTHLPAGSTIAQSMASSLKLDVVPLRTGRKSSKMLSNLVALIGPAGS